MCTCSQFGNMVSFPLSRLVLCANALLVSSFSLRWSAIIQFVAQSCSPSFCSPSPLDTPMPWPLLLCLGGCGFRALGRPLAAVRATVRGRLDEHGVWIACAAMLKIAVCACASSSGARSTQARTIKRNFMEEGCLGHGCFRGSLSGREWTDTG
jgi:hypothetical protein